MNAVHFRTEADTSPSMLTGRQQWGVFAFVFALASLQLVGIDMGIVTLGVVGAVVGWHLIRSPFLLLAAIFLFVLPAKFVDRGPAETEISVIELLGATAILASVVHVAWDALTVRRMSFYHPAFLPIVATAAWGILWGIVSVFGGGTKVENFVREFLVYWAVLSVPLLYRRAQRSTEQLETKLFWSLLVVWFSVQILTIIKIRSRLAVATYLFETGSSRIGVVGTVLMTLLLFALLATTENRKLFKWFVAALCLSAIGLILTFERAVWLGLIVTVPLLLAWFPKQVRRRAVAGLVAVVLIFIVCGVIAYARSPLFQAGILYQFHHLTSSAKVGSDPSLVNRYIEWRYVLQQIAATPLTGIGFGGVYKLYGWIVGVTAYSGYTHNTFLGWLLKFGIVGGVLLLVSFVWFLRLGIRLAYTRTLSMRERLICRVCVGVMVFCLGRFLVSNMFNEREDMLYLGLIWAYLTAKAEVVKVAADRSNTAVSTYRTIA